MSALDNVKHIKVFPGIGTARVGNSPEYFIGPEIPGDVPNLGKPYKDSNGLLKPQAARFRVYGYDENHNLVSEITHDPDNGVTLQWDVHMRNLKAANYAFQGKFGFNPDQYRNPGVSPNTPGTDPNSRTNLIIDPGSKTISGSNCNLQSGAVPLDGGVIFKGGFQAEIPTSLLTRGATGNTMVTYKEKEVSLGRLETDPGGRLIVVGGKGEAGCLIEPPIILQKGTAIFNGINCQIGAAQPTVDDTATKPNTFYTNETKLKIQDLDQVSIKLAGNEGGNDPIAVSDVLKVYVNGATTPVFTHDFRDTSNQNKVTPHPPFDITTALSSFIGQTVTIKVECINVSSPQQGSSDIYLAYINENPTSNGNSYFNNPGWYDDTAGGSINAMVTIKGANGQTTTLQTGDDPEKRGWVAVSPPKYTPTMNNVVSLLDLQLAMFPEADPVSGVTAFAFIDDNGCPQFATEKPTGFAPLDGVSAKGKASPSIARYNGKEYYAYTSDDGEFLIAESSNGGKSWTENKVNAVDSQGNAFNKTTDYAPSLCVYNGALTYVVVIPGGDFFDPKLGSVYVGTSTDGVNFTFDIPMAKGVAPQGASTGPSAIPYNGRLYIAYGGGDGSIVIAHRYLEPSNRVYFYKYDRITPTTQLAEKTNPSLGVFFGRLYCAYTGSDCNSYIGEYSNYSPAPAEPATVSFDFNQVKGAPGTKLSPTIASSLGKLYYAIIDENSHLNLATPLPGLYDVTFKDLGPIDTASPIAIANFSDIEFYRDVYPTLKTVTDYAWVNEPAFHGHAPGKPGDFLRENSLPFYSNPDATNNVYRLAVFNFLRQPEQLTPLVPPPPARIPNTTDHTVKGVPRSIPDGGVQTGTLMPHLFGEGGSPLENGFNGTNFPNQWLSLTPHQLWKFQEWVNGNFTAGIKPVTPHVQPDFYNIPLEGQPQALNFSGLEPTVGGGFHPGIELTYYMKERGFFKAPFRFAKEITHNGESIQPITPGSVAGYMSIPWQGDFWSCNISWWAAMRPDIVIPKEVPPPFIPWYRGEAVGIPANADNIPNYEGGYEHMVRYWSDFGFVVPTGQTDQGMFIMEESERNPCLDNAEAPCIAKNQPENALIGAAYPATPSSAPSSKPFYTNSIDLLVPASGEIILAGSSDGTADIFVDDEVEITMSYHTWKTTTVDGIKTTTISEKPVIATIYSHDFSNGNSGKITPLKPVNLTEKIRSLEGYHPGTIVTLKISYTDTYGVSKSASEFWLVYPKPLLVLKPEK